VELETGLNLPELTHVLDGLVSGLRGYLDVPQFLLCFAYKGLQLIRLLFVLHPDFLEDQKAVKVESNLLAEFE